jgi:hypothetical protein
MLRHIREKDREALRERDMVVAILLDCAANRVGDRSGASVVIVMWLACISPPCIEVAEDDMSIPGISCAPAAGACDAKRTAAISASEGSSP